MESTDSSQKDRRMFGRPLFFSYRLALNLVSRSLNSRIRLIRTIPRKLCQTQMLVGFREPEGEMWSRGRRGWRCLDGADYLRLLCFSASCKYDEVVGLGILPCGHRGRLFCPV